MKLYNHVGIIASYYMCSKSLLHVDVKEIGQHVCVWSPFLKIGIIYTYNLPLLGS